MAIEFRPYQIPIFQDNSTGVLCLHWARQIGKSYVLAAWAIWRLLTKPGRLVTVLSNSKDNGIEFALQGGNTGPLVITAPPPNNHPVIFRALTRGAREFFPS